MQTQYTIFDVLKKYSDQLGSNCKVYFDGTPSDYNRLSREPLAGSWKSRCTNRQVLTCDSTRYFFELYDGSFRDELAATASGVVQKVWRP